MPWAAVGAIGGALIASNASSNAANAAQQTNQANISAQQLANQQNNPFAAGGNRAQYVNQLNQLMQGGYQGLQNNPMYQWMQQQGLEQVQRANSATGQSGSGNEMIALQNQGFGLANQFFNQQYARLAELSGASGPGTTAAQGQSPGAAFGQQMGLGQSQVNAFGTGLGGIQNLYGSLSSGYGQQGSGQQLANPGQAPAGYNWGSMATGY